MKWIEAAPMFSDIEVIYPDLGHPVDSSEMQKDILFLPITRKGERALIP